MGSKASNVFMRVYIYIYIRMFKMFRTTYKLSLFDLLKIELVDGI